MVEKVQVDWQSRKFSACGTEGVHGENVNLDQPGKSREAGSDTPPHNPFEGVRASIVGHYPPYFQRSKTRDFELDHLTPQREEATPQQDIPDLTGLSPLSTAVTAHTLSVLNRDIRQHSSVVACRGRRCSA